MRGAAARADEFCMPSRQSHHCLAALLTAVVVWLVPGSAAASQPSCAGASAATTTAPRFQKVMLCLHNAERRRHGLGKVRWNRALARVASKYSRAMVANHFFDHYSPSHRDHMDRIARSSYRPDSGCWAAGENLFFSARVSTPRQLMKAWMGSAVHRRDVLRSGWRDFGLGVAYGSPYGGSGMTVVALFGVRPDCG